MPDPLTTVPDQIIKGDTLDLLFTLDDFKAGDGWGVTLYLVGAVTNYNQGGVAEGDNHRITIVAANTDTLTVETVTWSVIAIKGAEIFTAASGSSEVTPNITSIGPSDLRTANQRILDAIEARIENRASVDQNEYTIKDRQIKKMTIDELLKWQAIYQNRVNMEKRKEKGQGTPLIKVRFQRP